MIPARPPRSLALPSPPVLLPILGTPIVGCLLGKDRRGSTYRSGGRAQVLALPEPWRTMSGVLLAVPLAPRARADLCLPSALRRCMRLGENLASPVSLCNCYCVLVSNLGGRRRSPSACFGPRSCRLHGDDSSVRYHTKKTQSIPQIRWR